MSFLKILTENFCHICSRAFVHFLQAASVSLIRSVTIFCERFSKRGQTSFWTSVRLSSYQLTFEFRTGVFLKMRRGWLAASIWSQKKAFFSRGRCTRRLWVAEDWSNVCGQQLWWPGNVELMNWLYGQERGILCFTFFFGYYDFKQRSGGLREKCWAKSVVRTSLKIVGEFLTPGEAEYKWAAYCLRISQLTGLMGAAHKQKVASFNLDV